MIGYIVVVNYHYDSTDQVEHPSKVYLDYDEALVEATKQNGSGCSGYVWEIELPSTNEPAPARPMKCRCGAQSDDAKYHGWACPARG